MTTTETLDAIAPYQPLRAQIAELKAANANTVFRYEEPKGNKLARSHVASLRTVKGDIERKRKDLKADALEYGRKVDSVAKELTAEIEAMIDVHQGPLDLIESREEARVAKMEAILASATVTPEGAAFLATSEACRSAIGRIVAVPTDESLAEFRKRIADAKDASLILLNGRLHDLTRQEAEAAELARLREEQAKRDAEAAKARAEKEREEREARIAAEAAEKAKRQAEQAAEAERQRAAAAARLEAERKEREASAALEAEREKTRKATVAAEKAKREKAEAEAKAEREEQEKRDAGAKRAANVKHRAAVMFGALEALTRYGVDEANAKLALEAIAAGKVPHVTVNF